MNPIEQSILDKTNKKLNKKFKHINSINEDYLSNVLAYYISRGYLKDDVRYTPQEMEYLVKNTDLSFTDNYDTSILQLLIMHNVNYCDIDEKSTDWIIKHSDLKHTGGNDMLTPLSNYFFRVQTHNPNSVHSKIFKPWQLTQEQTWYLLRNSDLNQAGWPHKITPLIAYVSGLFPIHTNPKALTDEQEEYLVKKSNITEARQIINDMSPGYVSKNCPYALENLTFLEEKHLLIDKPKSNTTKPLKL